jgi:hypothetical protein
MRKFAFPHRRLIPALFLGTAVAFASTGEGPGFRPEGVPYVFGYSVLKLSRSLSKTEVAGYVQKFVDQTYGRAFRYLGDEEDFDHGHFLFNAKGECFAIVYHTQEGAHRAHVKEPGSKYDYLDGHERSWIQFLPDGHVEKAEPYAFDDLSNPEWAWYYAAYTVVDAMLDPAKTGDASIRDFQLTFRQFDCSAKDLARRESRKFGPTASGGRQSDRALHTR